MAELRHVKARINDSVVKSCYGRGERKNVWEAIMGTDSRSLLKVVEPRKQSRHPYGSDTADMFRRHAEKAETVKANAAEPPVQEELDDMWDNVPV